MSKIEKVTHSGWFKIYNASDKPTVNAHFYNVYTNKLPHCKHSNAMRHLPPATQERGIRPNLSTLGISLHDASIGGRTLL